jgi:hypothetical protein
VRDHVLDLLGRRVRFHDDNHGTPPSPCAGTVRRSTPHTIPNRLCLKELTGPEHGTIHAKGTKNAKKQKKAKNSIKSF